MLLAMRADGGTTRKKPGYSGGGSFGKAPTRSGGSSQRMGLGSVYKSVKVHTNKSGSRNIMAQNSPQDRYYRNAADYGRRSAASSSGGGGGGRGGSGGGGGGGGSARMAAAEAPAQPVITLPDLDTYISQAALLKGVEKENDRLLGDYDAATKQQKAETDADMTKREGYLDDALEEAGTSNAESFASRGLGRSGMVLKAQQDIDEQGEQQRDSINQMMTQLLTQRAAGRLNQIAQNRTNRQNAINQLTQTYQQLAGMPNVQIAS